MNVETSKIKSYVGFAIKSKHIKYGVDEILKMKFADVILFSNSLGNSSREKLLAFSKNTNSKIFEFEEDVFDEIASNNKNLKAVAITDKNLANAIKKIMTE